MSAPARPALRSRLALRVHLLALAPVLAIVAVLLVLNAQRPAPEPPRVERDLARHLAVTLGVPDDAAMSRVREGLGLEVALYTAPAKLVRASGEVPLPPLDGAELAELARVGEHLDGGVPSIITVPWSGGGEPGYLRMRLAHGPWGAGPGRGPRGPPHERPVHPAVWMVLAALAATSVGAFFIARSLTRPLAGLKRATEAFGAGELTARAGLTGADELSQLGASFDHMAERIAALVRSQQELLANVSHELRTPLARIRVALDLAAEGDAAMAREALGEIAEDLAELEGLVADVLATARLDLSLGRAGPSLPVGGGVVALESLVDKAAARFAAAHPGRVLTVLAPGLATERLCLDGDPILLRRALDNVLDNAAKYSEAPTPVVLELGRAGESLQLAVVDQGIGIAAEDLDKITTPFFRTDRSRNRKSGGLGLGLSLARRIVEAHRGRLELTSAVGVGTRVALVLPLSSGG